MSSPLHMDIDWRIDIPKLVKRAKALYIDEDTARYDMRMRSGNHGKTNTKQMKARLKTKAQRKARRKNK